MKMLGPVTAEDQDLAHRLATVLQDSARPRLTSDDDPGAVTWDAAYGLGMHLARIARASRPRPGVMPAEEEPEGSR